MIYQKTKLINLGTYIDKITQIMPLIKILKFHNSQIGIWKINENENKLNLLKSISNEYHPEVNQYKSKHKKNQVLSTKLLANKLYPKHELIKNKLGKPILQPDNISISISNDQDLIVMMASNKKCGIDLQTPKKKIHLIQHKFINKNDFSYNGNIEDLLWTWCAKECMYKIYGVPEIFFKDHLIITRIDENTLNGQCIHDNYLFNCQLNKMLFNNCFLVYTSNFEPN